MKRIPLILAILTLTTTLVLGKKNAVKVEETFYAVGVSQLTAGTGHGMGYELNGAVIKGRKSLEVGLIYSDKESRLAGGDFKYRIMLGNFYSIQENSRFYTPYLQYNLLYQKSTSYSPDLVELGGETYEIAGEPGLVATMGHFLAYGNKIKLFSRAYLDTSLGLGVYQGSLDQINGPGTWGVHKENHGFTYSFKIGFGYTFN